MKKISFLTLLLAYQGAFAAVQPSGSSLPKKKSTLPQELLTAGAIGTALGGTAVFAKRQNMHTPQNQNFSWIKYEEFPQQDPDTPYGFFSETQSKHTPPDLMGAGEEEYFPTLQPLSHTGEYPPYGVEVPNSVAQSGLHTYPYTENDAEEYPLPTEKWKSALTATNEKGDDKYLNNKIRPTWMPSYTEENNTVHFDTALKSYVYRDDNGNRFTLSPDFGYQAHLKEVGPTTFIKELTQRKPNVTKEEQRGIEEKIGVVKKDYAQQLAVAADLAEAKERLRTIPLHEVV